MGKVPDDIPEVSTVINCWPSRINLRLNKTLLSEIGATSFLVKVRRSFRNKCNGALHSFRHFVLGFLKTLTKDIEYAPLNLITEHTQLPLIFLSVHEGYAMAILIQ